MPGRQLSQGPWGLMGLGKTRLCGAHLGALAAVCLLAGCSASDKLSTVDPRYGVSSSARLVAPGEPVPKGGGTYKVGPPYTVAGRTYVPAEDPHYRAEGVASWYGEDFHGRQTANGEIFDMNSVSAAHATLPIPSYARVTNLSNNRSVIVRVNDRGPYHSDRVIDVSVKTAILLGFYGSGLAPVRVEYVGLPRCAKASRRRRHRWCGSPPQRPSFPNWRERGTGRSAMCRSRRSGPIRSEKGRGDRIPGPQAEVRARPANPPATTSP